MADLVVRAPGEGEPNSAFLRRIYKIRGKDSDGSVAVFEEEVPAGLGPPLHIHEREEEVFRVLEGRFRFVAGEGDMTVGAGTTLMIPRGLPHTFKNTGEAAGRLLIVLTPPYSDGFFDEVEAKGLTPPEDMDAIADIGRRYGLTFVGPPL